MEISALDSRQVTKEMCQSYNLCFYCKAKGHGIRTCPKKRQSGNAWDASGNWRFISTVVVEYDNSDPGNHLYIAAVVRDTVEASGPASADVPVATMAAADASAAVVGHPVTTKPLMTESVIVNGAQCSLLIDCGVSYNVLTPGTASAVHQNITVHITGKNGTTRSEQTSEVTATVKMSGVNSGGVEFPEGKTASVYDGILGKSYSRNIMHP